MNCFSSKCAALLLIVRPVSSASAAFVEAFENPDISVSETKEFFVLFVCCFVFLHSVVFLRHQKKEKIALMKAAAEGHQQYYRDCMTGQGL